MVDSVLIQNERAHQIWRDTSKASLPPMTAELLAAVIEAPADTVNEGDLWDGAAFSTPAPARPAIVPYSAFRELWTDDEKAALHASMATSWQIEDFVGLARAQNSVNLVGATAVAAKAAIVSLGILTQERADTLFG